MPLENKTMAKNPSQASFLSHTHKKKSSKTLSDQIPQKKWSTVKRALHSRFTLNNKTMIKQIQSLMKIFGLAILLTNEHQKYSQYPILCSLKKCIFFILFCRSCRNLILLSTLKIKINQKQQIKQFKISQTMLIWLDYKIKFLTLFIFNQPTSLLKDMDLFRRINTQKKKFKVQFFIGRLKFSSYRAGKVYIVIKRGDHKVKSDKKLEMTADNKLNFNKQILQVESTLYFDEKNNCYQQKLGQLSVVLLDQKQNKILLGTVPFDIAYYANLGQQSVQEKKKLQQTPKKLQGLIEFNVFIKYIGQGSQSSIDKVSDFFFGKSKEEIAQEATKQKLKQSQTKKTKKKDKKDNNYQKQVQQVVNQRSERSKTKQKIQIKPQFQKYKANTTKQNEEIPKDIKNIKKQGLFQAKKNKIQSDFASGSEENSENNTFYFDQPQTNRSDSTKNKVENQKRSISTQKPMKVLKIPQTKQKKQTKNKMPYSQEQESPSEEQIYQTSEVEPIQVNGMFNQSQVQSTNSEPVKLTKTKHTDFQQIFMKKDKKQSQEKKDVSQKSFKSNKREKISVEQKKKQIIQASKRQQKRKSIEKRDNAIEYTSSNLQTNQYLKSKAKNQNKYEEIQKSPERPIQIEKSSVNKFSKGRKMQNDQQQISRGIVEKGQISMASQMNQQQQQKMLSQLQKQNESLRQRLQKSEQIIKQLKNQLSKQSSQVFELSQQVEYFQSELQQKQQELQNFKENLTKKSKTQNQDQDKSILQSYQQQIKRIERQKNELIVQNSKLKEKYKKDFSKYEQILSEMQEKEQQSTDNAKAQIQKLKKQISSFRQNVEKLSREKEQRTAECNRQRSQGKSMQAQLVEVKDSLSLLKLKICSLLNEALATGQQSTIELLMDLNKH